MIWLYGPPGVGKSTAGWALLNRLADSAVTSGPPAFVDIDQLGMLYPAPTDDPWADGVKVHALAAVAEHFSAAGVATLVVSGVLDPARVAMYREVLAGFELGFVRLIVSRDELVGRLEGRHLDPDDVEEVLRDDRDLSAAELLDPVVATDGLSPEAVAERVSAAVTFSSTAPGRSGRVKARPPGRAARRLRVVLVMGAAGVGKSAATWSAFTRLRTDGTPVGYLDLRQLGMVGRDGGAVDHGLQARNARAVAGVFHDGGAEVVLINGRIDSEESWGHYRSEFGDTELRHLRLRASGTSLTERFLLRAAGGGPELAGDAVRGISQANAVRLAAAAEREQAAGTFGGVIDLDTTEMTVEEAGLGLLAALRGQPREGSSRTSRQE